MLKGRSGDLRAGNWLALAAAPTFALMALLTTVFGGGHTALTCSQAQQASALSGMAPMYLLMAAFHLPPWFRLTESPGA
jgi:hypothetical protein